MTTETRGEIHTRDGITLSTANWEPDSPKALLLLAHGHAEHIGRHRKLIDALTERGYAVAGQDHRGHGRSTGERALAMRFDDYIDDFRLMALEAQERHPNLPVLLFGHSMGGLIAARYALEYQADLSGLVLTGAAFTIDEGVAPPIKWAVHRIARVFPKAPVPRNDEDNLSTDPAVREAFINDPLNYHGTTRMRTASEMARAGENALERASTLTVPLLIMHGEIDALTSPRGTERFFERAGSPDKTLRIWPGMKHEVFNEIEGATVITYTLDWLDTHATSRNATVPPLVGKA
jgi:alpha-beta hydrolase superfamily lysophospholipase